MLERLLKSGEDANAVETNKEQGYGPIHYIFSGRHKSKRELLLTLLVYGNAKLDLTTTKYGVTALHIAVEVSHSGPCLLTVCIAILIEVRSGLYCVYIEACAV